MTTGEFLLFLMGPLGGLAIAAFFYWYLRHEDRKDRKRHP